MFASVFGCKPLNDADSLTESLFLVLNLNDTERYPRYETQYSGAINHPVYHIMSAHLFN